MKYLSFLLLLLYQTSYCQQISGIIKDNNGKNISNVNILLKKDSIKNSLIAYTISDEDGKYSLKNGSSLNNFIIQYKSLGYLTKKIIIANFSKKDTILNITLTEEVTPLKEVFIKSKTKPIVVKKDTISYNPESFKDNTERVVEDLLKKLPGIVVKDNGQILFDRKPIQSILLDGDDLFEENYTIGSKNISIDQIEKIEAISNYNKNPLLASIKKSEEVVLNLVIKKGESDFSNNTDIDAGFENKISTKLNTLGISKKIKTFATGSYNNIGDEDSPYDFFSPNSPITSTEKNSIIPIRRILSNGDLSTPLNSERARINNNLFGSLNGVYKPINKLSLTTNVDVKTDRLERELINTIDYTDDFETDDILQSENLLVKPTVLNFKLRGNYKISNTEIIESKSIIKSEKINSLNIINLNTVLQNTSTETTENIYEQTLKYTKKINETNAIVTKVTFNNTNLTQELELSPDVRTGININQFVDTEKNQLNIESSFLKSGKNFNSIIGINYDYSKSNLFSSLSEIETNTINSSNDFSFTYHLPTLFSNLYFKPANWSFRLQVKTGYLEQVFFDRQISFVNEVGQFFIVPRININYYFNKIAGVGISGSYNQRQNNESTLFSNPINTSNRNVSSYIPRLQTLNSYFLKTNYFYNDYFNITFFSAGITYQNNLNNFITDYRFEGASLNNIRQLLDIKTESFSSYIRLERYVGLIKSNVKLNLDYSINNFNNFINESELRNNSSNNGYIDLNIKTGFLGKINFENNIQFSNARFNAQENATNSNSTLTNSFKTYFKPKQRVIIMGSVDYFKPNFNKENSFLFFDASIKFTSKNNKIDYFINSRNATVQPSLFISQDVSDFYLSNFTYNIVEPFIIFGISFKL